MGKERITCVDLTQINPAWPAGPTELFLRNREPGLSGICVSILSGRPTGQAWEKLARGRVYYVDGWRVLGDAFINYPARRFGLHRDVLVSMRLLWCLAADLVDPKRIIWAPGIEGDPKIERKATHVWLRPLLRHELRLAPPAIWALARESRRFCKGSPTGLWCVDETHLPMLKWRAAELRKLQVLPYRINSDFALDVKLTFSERALGCLDAAE